MKIKYFEANCSFKHSGGILFKSKCVLPKQLRKWGKSDIYAAENEAAVSLQPERCYQSDLVTSPLSHNPLLSFPLSERSIYVPRASFSVSPGLRLFSSRLRLQSGVSRQRTFSKQPWQWWNASAPVQGLHSDTQWWECWLSPCVRLCARAGSPFYSWMGRSKAAKRGPFDVWHFESAQMFAEHVRVRLSRSISWDKY